VQAHRIVLCVPDCGTDLRQKSGKARPGLRHAGGDLIHLELSGHVARLKRPILIHRRVGAWAAGGGQVLINQPDTGGVITAARAAR